MQIGSKQFYQSQLSGMSDLQTRIGRLQEEISTGKQILQPSDDPAGYVKVANLKQGISATQQYGRNIDVATQRLTQEDTTLSKVVNAATRLQELAIQGANDTNDLVARKAIAAEMTQISDQLVSLGNAVDANGDYIFGGYHASSPPFVTEADGSVTYGGDAGRREVEIAKGVTTPTGSSGTEVFMQVNRGPGKPSASIFDLIKTAADALNSGQSCASSVGDLAASVSHFSTYQTICGARMQKVDDVQQIGQAAITNGKIVQSSLEDTKIEEVATELSQKSLNLTASQTSFSRIAQLSLFNYIK